MKKRQWKKFKEGFREPKVRRKLYLLILLILLFVVNLCWFQHERNKGMEELYKYIGTVYIQGVLGVSP